MTRFRVKTVSEPVKTEHFFTAEGMRPIACTAAVGEVREAIATRGSIRFRFVSQPKFFPMPTKRDIVRCIAYQFEWNGNDWLPVPYLEDICYDRHCPVQEIRNVIADMLEVGPLLKTFGPPILTRHLPKRLRDGSHISTLERVRLTPLGWQNLIR